jgi:hypothetical protein
MTAGEQLHQALQRLVDDRTPPPCTGDYLWLSERHEDRAEAILLCQPCPVLTLCHDFASTAKPPIVFGTFAGIDYTPTTRKAVA